MKPFASVCFKKLISRLERHATRDNLMLVAALAYARDIGFPVFPLYEPVEEGCSCRNPTCQAIGKHPRTTHGFKDATRDFQDILGFWTRWPNANIGVPTGKASGVIVVDADGPEGKASVKKLKFPPTLKVKTPHGYHYYFKNPKTEIKNIVRALPGIDFRGEGGYVVLPPSKHPDGSWEWMI